MWSYLQLHWLEVITGLFVVAVLAAWFIMPLERAAQTGDLLAGFAGALAFVWLIASFRQQSKELRLQREELSLQRNAIQLQTNELKHMARLTTARQVVTIVEAANNRLRELRQPFRSPDELRTACMSYREWKVILESQNPQHIVDVFNNWQKVSEKVEKAARPYLASLCEAARLYFWATDKGGIKEGLIDEQFFSTYRTNISQIPHLSEYSDIGSTLANVLLDKPDRSVLRLAGLTAALRLSGKNLNQEKEVKYLKKSWEKKSRLPKIAIMELA